MAFHVRDAAIRALARIKGKTLTETIRETVEHELATISVTPPLAARLQTIQADFQAMERSSGQQPDKAFFGDLSGHR
jgi:antitoxin VapB